MTKVQDSASDGALLVLATVSLRAITLFLWVALGVVVLVIPTIFLFQGAFMQGIAAGLADSRVVGDPASLVWRIALILIGAAAMLALTIGFFTLLHRMALTVRAGDPFIPRNARRLRMIAWLFLAMEAGSILLGIVSRALLPMAQPGNVDVSVTSIIAVLALFVLARVFERGTQLQAEIEGTV